MEDLQHNLFNIDLSPVLSACEPELQELMTQVDLIIKQQKKDWDTEMSLLRLRIREREDELEQKALEITTLCKRLEEKQEMVSKYERDLQNIREEFDELKSNYHKLQHKQLKEARRGVATNCVTHTGPFEDLNGPGRQGQQSCVLSSQSQRGQASRVGNQGRDRTPLTTHSEGALKRFFERLHIVASVSEESSLGLAPDQTTPSSSTSGSTLTLGDSAPNWTAIGPNSTSNESVVSAFQDTPSESRADHTVCCFLEEEKRWSTKLLQRLDGHLHHMDMKTQSK